MSKENVEIAKRMGDAFNACDIDAMLDLSIQDVTISSVLLDSGADFQGREGLERYFAMLAESWDDFYIDADEYRDLGERVLGLGRFTGRGKGSGVTVSAPATAAILDFRDGKVSRIGFSGTKRARRLGPLVGDYSG
jgi:ketosteroid isomerase-like protein